jgi:hypothetical protein
LVHRIDFDKGHLNIQGRTASLHAEVTSLSHAAAMVDWIKVTLSQFLSIQLGVYSSMELVGGTISDKPFTVAFPGASHCALVTLGAPSFRSTAISSAVNLIPVNSPSYARFVTCSLYYQHALRLLSPHEVSFAPYVVASEVILNLTKCIELLFPHNRDRDVLAKKLEDVGYTSNQIESQLISILVVRNEFDIGHGSSGVSTIEEISILREFLIRSVANVRALLLAVARKVNENPNFLAPMRMNMDRENRRRLRRLTDNLAEPPLPCDSECQIFIRAKVV